MGKRICQVDCYPISKTNNIDIFIVHLDKFNNQNTAMLQFLSDDELSRSSLYKFEKDKSKYMLRRALLRLLLSAYTGVSPNKLLFHYNQNGKPYLRNNNLYFNISHSGQHLALAISHHCEMGIDIEQYREFDDVDGIIKATCSHNEISALEKQSDRNIHCLLLKYWTGKEAYLKKNGKGLTIDPRRIQIGFHKRVQDPCEVIFDGVKSVGYALRSWKISSEPKLCISIFADEKASIRFLAFNEQLYQLLRSTLITRH